MRKQQINLKNMKKSSEPIKKKSFKQKSKTKKQDTNCYLIYDGGIYVASSQTQRKTYQQFQTKVKESKNQSRKTHQEPKPKDQRESHETKMQLEQYVKRLTIEEKRKLIRKLQEDMKIENQEEIEVEIREQKEDKLTKLAEKLQKLKLELIFKCEAQVERINNLFETEQISLQDMNEKITLMEKIKKSKLTMIQCTKVLFEKILKEESQDVQSKEHQIENMLKSLNSFTSIQQLQQIESSSQKASAKKEKDEENLLLDSIKYFDEQKIEPIQIISIQLECKDQKCLKNEQMSLDGYDVEKENQNPLIQNVFKLDLRLDEIEFGNDVYDFYNEEEKIEQNILQNELKIDKNATNLEEKHEDDQKKEKDSVVVGNESQQKYKIMGIPSLLVNQNKDYEDVNPFKIPLLMTKDKLEEIEQQKNKLEINNLRLQIDKKIELQLGCLQPYSNGANFTTLVDINHFIVNFYEFMMKKHMGEMVNCMNIPFGKSVVDKLYNIQTYGYVHDHDIANVLTEDHLNEYHREVNLTQRRLNQYEKSHNRAIFDAFNFSLNVYRPYYELEGEVFPWIVSEKGITFYEISDENIQEVFQKSKIKILEYCSNICGIMPELDLQCKQAKQILLKKHSDTLEKCSKNECLEKYHEWGVKFVNYDALMKMIIAEQVLDEELSNLAKEMQFH